MTTTPAEDHDACSAAALRALDAAERAQCTALARWLEASSLLSTLGLFAAAVTAACLLFPGAMFPNVFLRPLAATTLLLMPIERVFALRLRFDRGLFADLGSGHLPNLAALDAALAGLELRKTTTRNRSLAHRIRGTRRLWRRYVIVVAMQVLLCWVALTLRF